MSEKIDILIIGAGPAGVATAAALLKAEPALRDHLLVLERAKHPRHKLCGGGLTPWVDELLEQLDLSAPVRDFRVERVKFYLEDQPLEFDTPGIMRTIRRNEFDAALVREIRRKGVCVLENAPVEKLIAVPEGIRVETAGENYLAKVVVGADGAKSLVRRTFFPDAVSRVSRLIEVLVPAQNGQTHEFMTRTAVFDFRQVRRGLQGYVWDFPCWVDGQPHLNVGVFDSQVGERSKAPRANLPAMLREHLQARGCALDVELMGHPERWFHPVDQYGRPRVLLVGDAAGIEPWLGEGISTALAYGPIAARTILHALRSGDFSFADYPARIMSARLGKFLRRNRLVAKLFYDRRFYKMLPVFGRVLQLYMKRRDKIH
jgi:flavin-dependent dehydrogenase